MLRTTGRLLIVLLPLVFLCFGIAAAAAPTPWVTPLELDFGPVGIGLQAPTQVVTITNNTATPLINFAGGGLSAPFNVSQDCVIADGVLPGNSCHYFFDFKPVAAGVFTATSSSTTSGGPITVVVHAQGIPASVTATATSLDFGTVRSGSSAATQAVTIRNTGVVTLTQFAGGGLSAPFNVSQDCVIPGGIPPGGSCHYFFDFAPTANGVFSGVSSSLIQGVNVDIAVKGAGSRLILLGGQRVTPLGLDFGPVGVGSVSPTLVVTVTNESILNAIDNFAGGGVSAPFNASQDCAPSLPTGSSCHYFFTFAPTSTGVFTTTSDSITSAGPFSIALRGEGVGPVAWASPLSLDFGSQLLGVTAVQTVTIHNAGLAPLRQFAGGGLSAPFNVSQDCVIPGGIPPGGSCHYLIAYRPTVQATSVATSSSLIEGTTINIAVQGTGAQTFFNYMPLLAH